MFGVLSPNGSDLVDSADLRGVLPKEGRTDNANVTMSSTHKRKQSGSLHDQAEKKRPRQNIIPPSISAPTQHSSSRQQHEIASSMEDQTPFFLPSPPEIEMEVHLPTAPQHEQGTSPTTPARLESIRSVIQTQMGLEILLKHKELRLIDQEIAKCQASLEQLRRCTEIPFPAMQGSANGADVVAGPALRSAFPSPHPASPAPWGIQDGPYARHYAKWLLADPRFDGGASEITTTTPVGKSPMTFRSQTRGNFPEMPPLLMQSRVQRSGKLTALPAGYGQPKEKATGPMIVKRKSDGASVKLVCPDCGRFDFGSAQGFINHCRIGHSRSFASHDAAADACGEVVEVDASGAMIGIEPAITPTAGNVHPLIRSAKLLTHAPPRPTLSSSTPGNKQASSPVEQPVSAAYTMSSSTPNLSELVKHRGLGIDLQSLVTDARTKVNIPDPMDEDEIDEEHDHPFQNAGQGRHPLVAGTKQPPRSTQSLVASPLLDSSLLNSSPSLRGGDMQLRTGGQHGNIESSKRRQMTLSLDQSSSIGGRPSDPSPTSESNQAPSLVDDDEDFEPHSPSSSSVLDEHDMDEVAFEVHDDDYDRAILQTPDFQPSCTQHARPLHVRRPSAIRKHGEREEKHVSFVSPSPAREVPRTQPDDEKKRKV